MYDDLISRKSAIAEIARWIGYIDEDMINRIQIGLNRLPSAQPETHEERTETHACDLISRQAAIDAFDNLEWFHQNANKDMVSGANPEHHQAWYKEQDVYKALERVPSVQPEIVRCKDCKNFRRWIDTDITFCDLTENRVCKDDFCSKAERRTDEADYRKE